MSATSADALKAKGLGYESPANAYRLLWAGFFAIFTSGVGFAVRGGILANWGAQFGFTAQMLGDISGAGMTGFCFGIIIGGLVCDKLGYGKLVVAAFLFHVLSALVALAASPTQTQTVAFNFLYWGAFIFAMANGTLEAVANPLVATLFPHKRTHYLNILHASWPAGLVVGGLIGWTLADPLDKQLGLDWGWKAQLGLFLVPVIAYGIMFLGQHMPKSEASRTGLTLGEMFKDVGVMGGLVVCFLIALFFANSLKLDSVVPYGSYAIAGVLLIAIAVITNFSLGAWLLFVLFVAHALVGAVELGTDSWIQNITGNFLNPREGKILIVYTSAIMFSLRFCADFIERRLGLSPVSILLVCAVLASIGLNLASTITTFTSALLALAVYAIGKTFFWPTMLAVASDRFPRTGAIAISIMGGIGMMSAGLIGSPGLGYAKDRFTQETLEKTDAKAFEQYKAEKPSPFLFFQDARGLDGKKLGDVQKKLADVRKELEENGESDPALALQRLTPDERAVIEASIAGDRRTLVADSWIPATMAVIYLLLFLYFKAIGGYRAVHIAPAGQSDNSTGAGH